MLANVLTILLSCDVALFFPGSVLTRNTNFLIHLLFFTINELPHLMLFNALEENQQNNDNFKMVQYPVTSRRTMFAHWAHETTAGSGAFLTIWELF